MQNGADRAIYGATVSFQNQDGHCLTIAHTGCNPSLAVQHACARALAIDASYRIVAISTPATILGDLQGREIRHGKAQLTEGTLLKQIGLTEMVHPSLERGRERWSR